MISMDAAFGVGFFCLLIGAIALFLCYVEKTSKRLRIFWWTWLVLWALPLLVPAYVALWLGA